MTGVIGALGVGAQGTEPIERGVQRPGGVEHERGVLEGSTKTGRARVIDIDPGTVVVLKAWKRERGGLALALAASGALCFGNQEGVFRHPETFSKMFVKAVTRCRQALGEDAVPAIRLHDLRHTHATLLLADREPVKTVSERLGHASITVTLAVYGHVMPGDQKRAADRFAALIREA